LELSIRCTEEALEMATSADDHKRWQLLHELGLSYKLLYEEYQDPKDLERSNSMLEESFLASKLLIESLVSGLLIILNSFLTESWEFAATIIEKVINILPDVIPPFKSRDDAVVLLGKLGEMFSLLPTVYLNAGRTPMATLEVLENFRGIIASLMVDAKSDVSILKDEQPELWSQYTNFRDQIAQQSPNTASTLEVDFTQSYTASSRQYQRLYEKLHHLRSQIRKFPGFENFLLPPKGTEIMNLARDGPLVCFNVNSWGKHAFLVTSSSIEVINLPNLDPQYVQEIVTLFNVRSNPEKRDAHMIDSDDDEDVATSSPGLLLHLWDNAVKPILDKLGLLREANCAEKISRIWWVGGGMMSLMPLHAAGEHTLSSVENTLSHVVSSYSPSLKMLQFLRGKPPISLDNETRKLLIVSMPTTPGGHAPLNTETEVAAIKMHSHGLAAVTHLTQPTKQDVLKELSSCTLAHFACHGSVNALEPVKSSLVVGKDTEEHLTVDEAMDVIIHTGANIAYLSACSTAETKARNLINESIHLASAFQLAGFQHVIATLWRADDGTAVEIASKFYELLFKEQTITGATISYALHRAVLQYRVMYGSAADVLKWASFIHLGA
jgi:hypothetical protein